MAKVRAWETHEVNGFVFIWHDSEGREPLWRVPEVPQVTTGKWTYRGRTQHEVLAHIQVTTRAEAAALQNIINLKILISDLSSIHFIYIILL